MLKTEEGQVPFCAPRGRRQREHSIQIRSARGDIPAVDRDASAEIVRVARMSVALEPARGHMPRELGPGPRSTQGPRPS